MSKELLIKGGHVVTVGPDLEPTTAAAEMIEAAGRLVIPGLVDTTADPVRPHARKPVLAVLPEAA
jgi:dihydroorotase-like cyclic amidohydrolase